MPYEIIRVIAYCGFRGEQSPMAFSPGDRQITVVEVLDMWIEEGLRDKTRKRFFIVKGDDGQVHKLYYDEMTLEWFRETKEKFNTRVY